MNKQEILGSIGQIEASISKVEPFLTDEDFQEYCDSAYTCISMLRGIIKKKRTNAVNGLLNHIYTDFLMLDDGSWQPDNHSINDSITNIEQIGIELDIELKDTREN